ncbi:hypothetical protein SCATT_p16270 (plasmid) [Streptantibioticus cattleyicolor NRRL 8057 = DSM 46488]|uniref:Uncharacterized protein n=1 Tax=Streptantibioticus cattleyicolor (strain ATCC 35852 / DSM 46488 / JCM 4925 / NBRC 14057 / NRRL 8057) TaxID=1003195 RepID=G8XHI3_STREN|nr:hypothetical protein SCATT_p16270 [Streptantibioticus cattleyicolor NRRL 8057 = DSM 46488]
MDGRGRPALAVPPGGRPEDEAGPVPGPDAVPGSAGVGARAGDGGVPSALGIRNIGPARHNKAGPRSITGGREHGRGEGRRG